MDRETRNLILIAAGVGVGYVLIRKAYNATKDAVASGADFVAHLPTFGINLFPDPMTGNDVPVSFPNGRIYALPAGLFQTNWITDFFGGGTLTVKADNPQGIPPGVYSLGTSADGSRYAVPA